MSITPNPSLSFSPLYYPFTSSHPLSLASTAAASVEWYNYYIIQIALVILAHHQSQRGSEEVAGFVLHDSQKYSLPLSPAGASRQQKLHTANMTSLVEWSVPADQPWTDRQKNRPQLKRNYRAVGMLRIVVSLREQCNPPAILSLFHANAHTAVWLFLCKW